MATDIVPLIDAQTAAILASVNKYSIQQHVRVCDNCIEVPNTYDLQPRDEPGHHPRGGRVRRLHAMLLRPRAQPHFAFSRA